MVGRQPDWQIAGGQADASEFAACDAGGGDDRSAAARTAAEVHSTGDCDRLLGGNQAGCGDVERTAAADCSLAQADVAGRRQRHASSASLDAPEGHVAAVAGAQGDGAIRFDHRIGGHADAASAAGQVNGTVITRGQHRTGGNDQFIDRAQVQGARARYRSTADHIAAGQRHRTGGVDPYDRQIVGGPVGLIAVVERGGVVAAELVAHRTGRRHVAEGKGRIPADTCVRCGRVAQVVGQLKPGHAEQLGVIGRQAAEVGDLVEGDRLQEAARDVDALAAVDGGIPADALQPVQRTAAGVFLNQTRSPDVDLTAHATAGGSAAVARVNTVDDHTDIARPDTRHEVHAIGVVRCAGKAHIPERHRAA